MELLTVQETADLLKVSTVTVRRFIADGRLPAVRVGRAVRVEKVDAERVAKPVATKARPTRRAVRAHRPKAFTYDDPLWDVVGIADSGPDGPTDVSTNKDKYLAEAYADLHEE
jgi:excisionase family DNA binding protein